MGTRTIIIKRLELRFNLDIRRWNTNPTVQISFSIFGRDCVFPFFRPHYKNFQTLLFVSYQSLQLQSVHIQASIIPSQERELNDLPETGGTIRTHSHVSFALRTSTVSSANHSTFQRLTMGRFERLVSTPTLIELFKEKYHIPQEVVVRHCTTEGVEFDRKVGEVVIPMIAFI